MVTGRSDPVVESVAGDYFSLQAFPLPSHNSLSQGELQVQTLAPISLSQKELCFFDVYIFSKFMIRSPTLTSRTHSLHGDWLNHVERDTRRLVI